MTMILWLAAVILAIVGIVQLLQGQLILGLVLIIVAAMIGPGGYSVWGGGRASSAR